MKKHKKVIISLLIIFLLVIIEIQFNVIYGVMLQFSEEMYFDFVADIDYEKDLLNEPVCIMDKASDDTELTQTELSEIIAVSEMHKELADDYDLFSVATKKDDFQKTLQVLEWLTEHTHYSGAQIRLLTDSTKDILEYSFDKGYSHAINCRYKAIAFADCLVAVGIKAYPVCMMSSEFRGCHFTCMVYITELEKWCAFDPSFGCWFSDEQGNAVDIFEIREMFLMGDAPTVNGYNFNGTQKCFDEYVNGFLKYCISNLSTWQDNSIIGRTEKSFSGRKQFSSMIPEA